MDLGLKGKHAIVTGGSQGIGKAIARELAREGVDVAIVARKKEQLEATAKELSAETKGRVIALTADVTSREQVEAMVAQAAKQLGGLHILVNSGSSPGGSTTAIGPIETIVDEDLLRDFNTKYMGALRCARAVIPLLKEQKWGRIINISGTNARNAGNLSGGARNTSLVHFTKTLAVQLGRFGITVNAICPGGILTGLTDQGNPEAAVKVLEKFQPWPEHGRFPGAAPPAGQSARDIPRNCAAGQQPSANPQG